MQVGDLAKLHLKKRDLQKKRDKMIQDEFKRRQKEKVNLDQSSVKKGYIEKTKYIEKKKFETVVEKARKIEVELQENVTPNTFLTHSSNYQKVLTRTKQRIIFDPVQLKDGLTAINSFGLIHKQKAVIFTLEFEKEIECQPRPFLINPPHPQKMYQTVIVLPEVKEKEGEYAFEKIASANLAVLNANEFRHKHNNDKDFAKKIAQQDVKCFIKFELYKKSKFFEKLLRNGLPVFPIDTKKIPFALQSRITEFPAYIDFLNKHYLAITKKGRQQTFRLKTGQIDKLIENCKAITHELVAKLIERSKAKQNRLVRITAKTASSISFDLYNAADLPDNQEE